MGPCDVLRHNPYNAVSLLGHAQGVVTMWTPNLTSPVVKMLAHRVSCLASIMYLYTHSVHCLLTMSTAVLLTWLDFMQYQDCLFLVTWATHFVTLHVVSILLGRSHTELPAHLHSVQHPHSWQILTSCMITVKALPPSRKTLCCVSWFQSHAVFYETSHTLLHINPKAKMAMCWVCQISQLQC